MMKKSDKYYRQSLLNYFNDDFVNFSSDDNATLVFHALHKSIRSDLESLLNSLRCSFIIPEELTELPHSILNYGIDYINHFQLDLENAREELCVHLKEMIELFEPRLKFVNVKLEKNFDETENFIKLRIEASLELEMIKEPIVFSSGLDKNSGKFAVSNEIY